ncbi:hypothetical protein SUGI_0126660 [Cryptomeria japonica]|nr:hypothetical protein SUGI_0126660 [Cryptomeria japonica]
MASSQYPQQNSDLAIAMALAMASTPQDDDDFQCPTPAVSINQDLILKSCQISKKAKSKKELKHSISKPLKPVKTHQYTKKKTKKKFAEGKENTNEPAPLKLNSIVFGESCSTGSPAKINMSAVVKKGFDCDGDFIKKGVGKGMSIESRLLSRGKYRNPEIEALMPSAEEEVDLPSPKPEAHFGVLAEEGGLDSLSFEPGTQLNALMQLCCSSDGGQTIGDRDNDNFENFEADGSCSELEEEQIISLMTQVCSPCRKTTRVLVSQSSLDKDSIYKDNRDQACSPLKFSNICHDNGPCRNPSNVLNRAITSSGFATSALHEDIIQFKISNAHPGDEGCFINGVSSCGLPDNDLAQASDPCRIPNNENHQNMDHATSSRGITKDDVGVEGFSDEEDQLVLCPVCGIEISHLSDRERETHTNDCLDKNEIETVASITDIPQEDIPKTVVDVTRVVKWLDTLGLSRYADLFIKEEIDWDTLQLLTEEDLSNLGILTLGPRKKIAHALHELRKVTTCSMELNTNAVKEVVNMNDKSKSRESGNKLITAFFQGPSSVTRRQVDSHVNNYQQADRATTVSGRKRDRNKNRSMATTLTGIPEWLSVPGTPFRVDAFRHLSGDCCHWFLTHFHTDHYQGLTRSFRYGKVYCSLITARLVNLRVGVPWDKLHVIPLNERINIDGVYVTFVDANHCPGSVIILFEPPNGKPVLHTGDFRFCQEMVMNPILQSCNVHTLILDTTYCDPQYDFPKQETIIQFVLDAIQAEAFNTKTLFLIGTYTIGKERIFLEVARVLRKKVYVGAAKLRLLGCLGLPAEDMQWLTSNEQESHIHVVPLWSIANFKRMNFISKHYQGRYNSVVSFSPTGWSFGKGKKKSPGKRWQQGTIIRYEVPYSEHCSFTELREFVKFVAPDNIIPSVNNNSPQAADKMVATLLNDDS